MEALAKVLKQANLSFRVKREIFYNQWDLSFHDLIGESNVFNAFWIPRSSRRMTNPEFINKH